MKISHEVPLVMMDESREFNDYDYALVHLFENYPEYFEFYKKSLEMGREVILDNSLYELGKAFDMDTYKDWILRLQPTYYIVPDTFWDSNATIAQCTTWFNYIQSSPVVSMKSIGVAQGADYASIVNCYNFLKKKVNRIAFTFKFHPKMLPSLVGQNLADFYRDNLCDADVDAFTRVLLLERLEKDNVIDKSIDHHLLGSQNTTGLRYISSHYEWITSIDTSNPIMYGYEGGLYGVETGSNHEDKPKTTVNSVFDHPNIPNKYFILSNINRFRDIIS